MDFATRHRRESKAHAVIATLKSAATNRNHETTDFLHVVAILNILHSYLFVQVIDFIVGRGWGHMRIHNA
jgi:hypothetical protein